ncbi:MAG: STAS domain-containing protein [Solirubrobacteraceae bacterium]
MPSRIETSARSHPSSTAFGIWQRELEERTSVIAVQGELDLSTAPRLKWMLIDSLQAGLDRLVVDLSLASFMDSTALGVLVAVKRRLDGDQRLAIVCPRTDVLKIFEFAGMDEAFALFPTLDEALAHVRGHAAHSG